VVGAVGAASKASPFFSPPLAHYWGPRQLMNIYRFPPFNLLLVEMAGLLEVSIGGSEQVELGVFPTAMVDSPAVEGGSRRPVTWLEADPPHEAVHPQFDLLPPTLLLEQLLQANPRVELDPDGVQDSLSFQPVRHVLTGEGPARADFHVMPRVHHPQNLLHNEPPQPFPIVDVVGPIPGTQVLSGLCLEGLDRMVARNRHVMRIEVPEGPLHLLSRGNHRASQLDGQPDLQREAFFNGRFRETTQSLLRVSSRIPGDACSFSPMGALTAATTKNG
jgi:hypothetical protein